MATELEIIKTQIVSGGGTTTRKFIFEDGEIKTLGEPNSNQSVSLDFGSSDPTQDSSFSIDLGVERKLVFEWKLYKQTLDRANGSYTSTVKTFGEIRDYLHDEIGFPFGSAEYEISWTDKWGTRSLTCSFEDLTFDTDSGIYPKGSLSFKVKKVN